LCFCVDNNLVAADSKNISGVVYSDEFRLLMRIGKFFFYLKVQIRDQYGNIYWIATNGENGREKSNETVGLGSAKKRKKLIGCDERVLMARTRLHNEYIFKHHSLYTMKS
jgi:hypothetical protein